MGGPPPPVLTRGCPQLRWSWFLATEVKSTLVVMVVLAEGILTTSVTMFFIYTAQVLPTVLR